MDEVKWKDHPRSRGVYSAASRNSFQELGSSPLARGLLTVEHRAFSRYGIIPARAGSTECSSTAFWTPTDHPRSRGVYITDVEWQGGFWGSSPLARGLPVDYISKQIKFRIIPARAGSTRY